MYFFYFIVWLVLFEGLLLTCLFLEKNFKKHTKKKQIKKSFS